MRQQSVCGAAKKRGKVILQLADMAGAHLVEHATAAHLIVDDPTIDGVSNEEF